MYLCLQNGYANSELIQNILYLNADQHDAIFLFYCSPFHLLLLDIIESHRYNMLNSPNYSELLSFRRFCFGSESMCVSRIEFIIEHICLHLLNEYLSNVFSNLEYVYCNIFGSVLIIVPYACIFLNQVAGNDVQWSPDEQWFSDSNKNISCNMHTLLWTIPVFFFDFLVQFQIAFEYQVSYS